MKTITIKTWAAMKNEFGLTDNGDIESFVIFTPSMEDCMPTSRTIEVFEDIDGMHWKIANETFRIIDEMIDIRENISFEEKNLNNTRQLIKNNKDIEVIAKVNCIISWDINASLSEDEIQVMLLEAIDKKICSLQ